MGGAVARKAGTVAGNTASAAGDDPDTHATIPDSRSRSSAGRGGASGPGGEAGPLPAPDLTAAGFQCKGGPRQWAGEVEGLSRAGGAGPPSGPPAARLTYCQRVYC